MTDHLSRKRSVSAVTWERKCDLLFTGRSWEPELLGAAVISHYSFGQEALPLSFIQPTCNTSIPRVCWYFIVIYKMLRERWRFNHPKIKPTVVCREGAEEGICVWAGRKAVQSGPCGHCLGTERFKLQQQRHSWFINSLIVWWKERQTLPQFCWCSGFHTHNQLHVHVVAMHPSQNSAPGGLNHAVLLQLGISMHRNKELNLRVSHQCRSWRTQRGSEGMWPSLPTWPGEKGPDLIISRNKHRAGGELWHSPEQ